MRLRWLDGLRALAILSVIIVHSSQGLVDFSLHWRRLAGLGQYGVQLFFVISALAIYLTLSATFRDRLSVWGWYVKRILRIAPMYYLALIGYVPFFVYVKHKSIGAEQILANLGFVHGFVESANNNVVPGGWSIGVEMAFYLVAPALFLLLTRSYRVWGVVWGLAMAGSLALTWIWAGGDIKNNSFAYFQPFNQAPIFLMGMAVAHLTRDWLFGDEAAPLVASLSGLALSAAGLSAGYLAYDGQFGAFSHLIAPSAMGAGFCGVVLLARGGLRSLFDNPVAVYIGRISYSMYLAHFIILYVLRIIWRAHGLQAHVSGTAQFVLFFAIALIGSVLVASVTRVLIEKPCIRVGAQIAASLSRRAD